MKLKDIRLIVETLGILIGIAGFAVTGFSNVPFLGFVIFILGIATFIAGRLIKHSK